MKIAFMVPYVPNRIRTRSFNLVHHLSKLGHEVVVFTLGSQKTDLEDAEQLKLNCKDVYYQDLPAWQSMLNCLAALPSGKPLQSVYSWHRILAIQLLNVLEKENAVNGFDIVHVEHLRGSQYGLFIKSKFPNVSIVWDSVDCISYLFEQAMGRSSNLFGKMITRFELKRTRVSEKNLIGLFDHVLITSKSDRDALLALPPMDVISAPISVLANGVDMDYFQPNPEYQREAETIVFSGKMSYHANITMVSFLVQEIMPLVWKRRPNIRLTIVGKDPNNEIKKFAKNPMINVTGTVDDIRPYLWEAAVAVVPLVYGAGIQNKILEAMACGTPVVTTSKTVSALDIKPGRDVLIGNTPNEFSSKVVQLIEDPGLRRSVSAAGLNYVKQYHNWKNISSQLAEIYEQSIHDRKKQRD